MARVLHLTDLHLTARADPRDAFDDYKSEIVPANERVLRHDLLHNTLRAISRQADATPLDAVVITGDITIANEVEGFEALSVLLDELHGVPNERVVVVPGNHDVAWRTQPSSAQRYQNFISYVRDAGFITPLLDGIDFEDDGVLKPSVDPRRHSLVLDHGRVMILPINSSNYCGVLAPIKGVTPGEYQRILRSLPPSDRAALDRALVNARLHDAARISPGQLEAAAAMLRELRANGGIKADSLAVVALHHQLLPVSTREEIKTFESLVNLGLFRGFLRSNGVRLVLHGHKHESRLYWDDIPDYNKSIESDQGFRVLVVAGSTIGGVDFRKSEVARLLELDTQSMAPVVEVGAIPAVDHGNTLNTEELSRTSASLFPLRRDVGAVAVSGETLDETYDKLMAVFDRTEGYISHIVATVISVEDVRLPRRFPPVPGSLSGEDWLRDIVSWWQRPSTRRSGPLKYTHGSRERRFGPIAIDQLDRVVRRLNDEPDSSRGIVVMIDPLVDDIADRRIKFPACCIIHFTIVKAGHKKQLNVTAYYRRQEMRYWWTVNIAELHRLMLEVRRKLRSSVALGSVTTVTTMAYAGEACPVVAVPTVDRLDDEHPEWIAELAFAVFAQSPERRLRALWDRVLDDLVPQERLDEISGVPVALDGLNRLEDNIWRFEKQSNNEVARRIAENLHELFVANKHYTSMFDAEASTPEDAEERHRKWRRTCEVAVERIRSQLATAWRE